MEQPTEPEQPGPIEEQSDAVAYFQGHGGEVYTVSCSSDPADPLLFCSGDGENNAYIVQGETGTIVAELAGHTDSVVCTAFTHDNSMVATGCLDGKIRVWQARGDAVGTQVTVCDGPDGADVEWLTWHPKGFVVMAGFSDGTIWLWHITNAPGSEARYMSMMSGHSGSVSCGCFSNDGKYIISAGADGTIRTWDPRSQSGSATAILQGPEFHGDTPVMSMVAHPTQPVVLTGDLEGNVVVTNLATSRPIVKLRTSATVANADYPPSVEALAISGAQNLAAAIDNDGGFVVIDTQRLTLRYKATLPHGASRLTFLGDSPILAAGCLDGTVQLYDGRTGELQRTLLGHNGMLLAMTVSAATTVSVDDGEEVHGRFIVTGGDDFAVLTFGPFVTN